jgi:hypothetical protein
MRSIGSLALFMLLLCGSVKAQVSPQLVADWTIYHVAHVPQGQWSTWYTQGPYPIRFRFMCSSGVVTIYAENMDSLTQGVEVRFWDVERDQSVLESAIANREALRNGGFSVSAGQSTLQRILRPAACDAGSLVFGAYLRGSNP